MRTYQLTDKDCRKIVLRRMQLLQYANDLSFPDSSGGSVGVLDEGSAWGSAGVTGVDVSGGTVASNFDLSSYYNSPSVSTTPTPDIGGTGNIMDQIDNFVGIGTSLAAIGLSQPSVSRPNRPASSTLGAASGFSSFLIVAILAVIGFFAYKAVK